jgi:hypothetical protein
MENDEEVVLSMVKEQLNHYKIKKVNDGKWKYSLALWKAHESQKNYLIFATWQTL